MRFCFCGFFFFFFLLFTDYIFFSIFLGSFKAPPPGRPITEPYDSKHLALGTKVDDLDDPVARQNFRVGIIRPASVEQLDLSDPEKARRWLYTYVEDKDDGKNRGIGAGAGSWTVEERWP